MTPEQLERAARHYCKLMGVDAEAILSHGAEPDERGLTPAIGYMSPRWKLVAKELHSFWAMNEALKEGMGDPKVDEVIGKLLEQMSDNPVDKGALNRWAEGKDEKGPRWEGGRGWVET